MILKVPHYYKDFKCIASACNDNCCMGGWEIDIDEETASDYLKIPGNFGNLLRESIDNLDGEYCFKLKDGKCPFLDDKNLCQIYQVLGEDKMGIVCTQFPRYTEYYGNIKETGIGLACEEAERIIFNDKESFFLISSEIDEELTNDPEYDHKLAMVLWPVRDKFFQILESKGNISFKLKILLKITALIQHEINNGTYENILKVSEADILSDITSNPELLMDGTSRILEAYEQLEVLNFSWSEYVNDIKDTLHNKGLSSNDYLSIWEEFDTYIKPREYEYTNLLKYYLFRYFMKAVYDHDVIGKIQLMTANYLVIREMDIVRYLNNNHNFSFQDRIDTVHVFSREVEYSEDNLENLAEEFLFDDIFEPDNLSSILI